MPVARFLFVVLLLAATGLTRATDLPDTPAAQRLSELTGLMSRATPMRVVEYIGEHYTPEYAERFPLEHRIASFMDWKARGGMQVVEITASESHSIETIAEHPLTGERWSLTVRVEAAEPHRVDTILIGRAPLPVLEERPDDQAAADQWIDYTAGLAEAGLFSGAVLFLVKLNESVFRTRDRPLHEDRVVVGQNLDHFQVLDLRPLVAHAAAHAHAFEDARGRRRGAN